MLCKGEPEEEKIHAFLTEKEVDLIYRDMSGEFISGICITAIDGRKIEIGIVDDVTPISQSSPEKDFSR